MTMTRPKSLLHAMRSVITVLAIGVCLVGGTARTLHAQDIEPEASCRTPSELQPFPQVFSSVQWGYNPIGTSYSTTSLFMTLHPNHQLVANSTCDHDKIKVILTDLFNVCNYVQSAPGVFEIAPCDCRFDMLFAVKAKFSQNYNINGGIIDPRRSSLTFWITHDNQTPGCRFPN